MHIYAYLKLILYKIDFDNYVCTTQGASVLHHAFKETQPTSVSLPATKCHPLEGGCIRAGPASLYSSSFHWSSPNLQNKSSLFAFENHRGKYSLLRLVTDSILCPYIFYPLIYPQHTFFWLNTTIERLCLCTGSGVRSLRL